MYLIWKLRHALETRCCRCTQYYVYITTYVHDDTMSQFAAIYMYLDQLCDAVMTFLPNIRN